MSLFDLKLIRENFLLVKSTKGKGLFCLFISSTFVVTGFTDNIIIMVATGVIGLGFLFVGFIRVSILRDPLPRGYSCF